MIKIALKCTSAHKAAHLRISKFFPLSPRPSHSHGQSLLCSDGIATCLKETWPLAELITSPRTFSVAHTFLSTAFGFISCHFSPSFTPTFSSSKLSQLMRRTCESRRRKWTWHRFDRARIKIRALNANWRKSLWWQSRFGSWLGRLICVSWKFLYFSHSERILGHSEKTLSHSDRFKFFSQFSVINFAGIFDMLALSPLSTIWGSVFAKANAIYNPIVYGISHPKYRQALLAVSWRNLILENNLGNCLGNIWE